MASLLVTFSIVAMSVGCTSTRPLSTNEPSATRVLSKETAILQANHLITKCWPQMTEPTPTRVFETESGFTIEYAPLPWSELGTNIATIIEVHKTEAKIHMHPKW